MKALADITYEPATGLFLYNGKVHGTINRGGYVVFRADSKVYYGHRVAWFRVHGVGPTVIDHKNGVRSDNRIENLRDVTQRVNAQNTMHGRGCHFHKPSQSWKSAICVAGRQIHLGYFSNPEEATECYAFAKEFFHTPLRSAHA